MQTEMKATWLAWAVAGSLALALTGVEPAYAIPRATTPLNDQTKETLIPSGALMRIAILQTISSSRNKKGDKFSYTVVDDVKAGSRVAIVAGTTGTGKVVDVRPAHGGRSNGRLRVEFDPLTLADGAVVSVAITPESVSADESEHNPVGDVLTTIADFTIPGFFIFDLLRKGDDVTLPANAPFHVGVVEDVFLSGGR